MIKKKPFSSVRRHKGDFSARGLRIGIVVSQFNEYLTDRLLDGALDTFVRNGARESDIQVAYVPGAFEIPLTASELIRTFRPNAVLTLAVVIRGETRHFDQVVRETAKGIRELAHRKRIPVILGMIAGDSVEHAIRRVGLKQTNKGREWALSAIEMANLMKCLRAQRKRRTQ